MMIDLAISLGVLVASATLGILPASAVATVMGFAAAPGSVLHSIGRVRGSRGTMAVGWVLALMAEVTVVAAYTVVLIGLLRWFGDGHPEVPRWPMWISVAVLVALVFYMANPPNENKSHQPVAAVKVLPWAHWCCATVLLIGAHRPEFLYRIFWFLPFSQSMLN